MKKFRLSAVVIALLMASCICTNNSASCGDKSSTAVSTAKIETPADAISALKAGNRRYVSGESQYPHSDADRREETLNGQNPYAVVVACSDSRVPVELLFDQGIGDLFVIRTAGNSVADDMVMGSVDYAVDHLETPLVVILGHQNCGGVTGAIAPSDGHEHHHNGKIGELLDALRQDVKPYIGHSDKLDEAIDANVVAQVERIKAVDYIQEKIKSGKLEVVGAYYNIDSGEVEFNR